MKYFLALFYNLWKIYVGIIFLLTLLLFYLLLLPFLYIESLKKYTFKINVIWSRTISILCFYRLKIDSDYSPSSEPKVIIANHSSYLDIFLLYCTLPNEPFLFMGKKEILTYPLLKTFFKRLNIPVDRSSSIQSAKAFIRAKSELKNGWSIVIFPEGGIFEEAPKLHPFKNGAFNLAKSANCAILPLTFQNNYRLLSDPTSPLKSAYPGIVKVKIHTLISPEEVEKSSIEELNQKSFDKIAAYLPKNV